MEGDNSSSSISESFGQRNEGFSSPKKLSNMAIRKLSKEARIMTIDPTPGISASPKGNNDLYEWDAVIVGPEQTPYSGGIFKLNIKFPYQYPFKPPKIKFVTKIYHLNISVKGSVCMDLLNDNWNPTVTIGTILKMIVSLLKYPNAESAFSQKACNLYKKNEEEYYKRAKEWTERYAV